MRAMLEYRRCPGCGADDFEVLFNPSIEEGELEEGVDTVYMLPGGKYGRHVRCRNCRLIYVNPIEKVAQINNHYSEMENGDAAIIRGSRLRAARAQVELVKKYNGNTRLLDMGCGEGFFLFDASREGYITKGVELSLNAARYARTEFGLDVDGGPFEEMRFPGDYFDVVTLWQVLEHLPQPLMALKEVYRVLRPGGLVVVSTPDIGGIPAKVLRRKWWNIRRVHINQFTTGSLMNILGNAGFGDLSSVNYKESISLLMLFIPLLKQVRLYQPLRALLHPGAVLGDIMNKMTLAYPSRLDNCVVAGFKNRNL